MAKRPAPPPTRGILDGPITASTTRSTDMTSRPSFADVTAERAAIVEAGNDVIRASNTLMLMLAGDLPITKPAVEAAIRRMLDARNAWDNAIAPPASHNKEH